MSKAVRAPVSISATAAGAGRRVPPPLARKLATALAGFGGDVEGLRMRDIAEISGIPRATLYYYFPSKEDALAFLLRSMLDDLRISVSEAIGDEANPAGTGTAHRLAAVVRAQLAHLAANPGTGRLLLGTLGSAGRIPTIAAGVEQGFHAPVRRLLADGIAAGAVRQLDVDVTSRLLYGAVTMVGLRALFTDEEIDVDRLAGTVLDVFWSGIAPTAPNPPGGAVS